MPGKDNKSSSTTSEMAQPETADSTLATTTDLTGKITIKNIGKMYETVKLNGGEHILYSGREATFEVENPTLVANSLMANNRNLKIKIL